MRTMNPMITALVMIALMIVSSFSHAAEKKSDDNDSMMGTDMDTYIVDYEDSSDKKDYQPKSDSEGGSWNYDAEKVELTSGTSDTGTNFDGARILKGNEDVKFLGSNTHGDYGDEETSSNYSYWEGSTLYFGANSLENQNSVDGIAEFFWFESSIPRGSDFYVIQLKVKTSPDTWNNWQISTEPNFIDEYLLFWNDLQPAQFVDIYMEEGGDHGSLRWDFCVPFETYEWEPLKVMQIKESYGAGYSVNSNSNLKGKTSGEISYGGEASATEPTTGTEAFVEGGSVLDLNLDAQIQSKGYVNNDFKVQSQYTVTLYKWQMLVQSGGQEMHYKTVVLDQDIDPYAGKDSAYHEYFIVVQSTRGVPVHIEDIHIGAMFRHTIPMWLDGYESLSVNINDIWITPPTGVCLPGDLPPNNVCQTEGVCGMSQPECIDNQWACPLVNVYQEIETLCDGLDNDCDGLVDEGITQECATACGLGVQKCQFGLFQECSAIQPVPEICDGIDNDCDGIVDNGCGFSTGEEYGSDSYESMGSDDSGSSDDSEEGSSWDFSTSSEKEEEDDSYNEPYGDPYGYESPKEKDQDDSDYGYGYGGSSSSNHGGSSYQFDDEEGTVDPTPVIVGCSAGGSQGTGNLLGALLILVSGMVFRRRHAQALGVTNA